MTCGATHKITGAGALVCEKEAGHYPATPHATLNDGAEVARWPCPWTEADEAALQARLQWSKPHVRREYWTSKMWKARQG